MSIFKNLKSNVIKSAKNWTSAVFSKITKRKLDQTFLEEIETALLEADFGPHYTQLVLDALKKNCFDKDVELSDVEEIVQKILHEVMDPYAKKYSFHPPHTPYVILMAGVNGSGKTTTCAKLAYKFQKNGHKVALIAADTFRDAAKEQLQLLGELCKTPVWSAASGSDPSALVYASIQQAKKEEVDFLIIDTAGRLHNNENLMEELSKMTRVMKKIDENMPHETLLVLDATTGQNTLKQAEMFHKYISLSGFVMTKLDGTAKGGTLVSLIDTLHLPVLLVGLGENIDDLEVFDQEEFIASLLEKQVKGSEEFQG